MQKIRGEITSKDGISYDKEMYLTIRLPSGHVVNVHYRYGSREIASGMHSTFSVGDVVSCALKEKLDLENRISYSGHGVVKKHDPTDVLDDIFEDFLGGATDRPFEQNEITLISIFCGEAAEAIKKEFSADKRQSEIIDAEFSELASAARTFSKKDWKKRFLAAIVNIGSAIAIDQAIGTTFIVTLAAILKEVIQGITKRYFLERDDDPSLID